MDHLSPGVTVREVGSGPRPIASVATAVAGFLGLFPHQPTVDAVAIQVSDGTRQLTAKVLPQLVDTSGTILPGSTAGAVASLTTAFRLRRHQIKNLRKLLELNGHRPTIGRSSEGRTRVVVGESSVEIDADVLDTTGMITSTDEAVINQTLDTVQATFTIDRPQPRTAGDLLEVFGLRFESARGTSLMGEYALPPCAVHDKSEFLRWLQSYYAQYLVETRTVEELLGRSIAAPDEAADAVFVALSTNETFARSFSEWLSQPTIFAFTTSVNGFYDNGGGKAYVYLMGVADTAGSIRENQTDKLGLYAFDDCDDLSLHVGAGLAPQQQRQLLEHCESRGDRFAVLDGPAVSTSEVEAPTSDPGFGAMYVPWVKVPRPTWYTGPGLATAHGPLRRKLVKTDRNEVHVPPSGHVAGMFARVDARRGVHKAPANEVLHGVTGVSQRINHQEQGHYAERGINVIRAFDDRGIRVWGARTLAARTSSEWAFVSVRRLFIMLEQSISQGIQWTVYEPNDAYLWSRITRDVRAYLLRLWEAQALPGATPEQAFFVRCDAETNPAYRIEAGQVRIQVGIATTRPAEFVVFSIGQWAGGSLIEEG